MSKLVKDLAEGAVQTADCPDQSKRQFMQQAGKIAVAGAAVATLSPTVYAKNVKYEATLVASWPGKFPFMNPTRAMADAVYKMSEGEFKINVYGAGDEGNSVSSFGVFDAVSSGQVQMANTASYYFKGKSPVHALFTAIPYGMNFIEFWTWWQNAGGQLYHDFLKNMNMGAFLGLNTGMQAGGWFRKEINSVEDLKGDFSKFK